MKPMTFLILNYNHRIQAWDWNQAMQLAESLVGSKEFHLIRV